MEKKVEIMQEKELASLALGDDETNETINKKSCIDSLFCCFSKKKTSGSKSNASDSKNNTSQDNTDDLIKKLKGKPSLKDSTIDSSSSKEEDDADPTNNINDESNVNINHLASENASIKIQAMIRGFLGKIARKKLWEEALEDLENYYGEKEALALTERKKFEALQRVKNQFISKYVNCLLYGAVNFFTETDASISIQRSWRGYSTRKKYPLIWKIIWKKPRYNPRYGPEVYRRLWAQRHFQPVNGWPGKSDAVYYDMWKYMDKPPKGRPYGLRTHKLLIAAKTEEEKRILKEDKNAWVGIPTTFVTASEDRPPPSQVELKLLESPYSKKTKHKSGNKIAPEYDPFLEYKKKKQADRVLKRNRYKKKTSGANVNSSSLVNNNSISNLENSYELNYSSSQYLSLNDSPRLNSQFLHSDLNEQTQVNEKKSSFWDRKFKGLFVTPIRSTQKPASSSHQAAMQSWNGTSNNENNMAGDRLHPSPSPSPFPSKSYSVKNTLKPQPKPLLSQSIGATAREILHFISFNNNSSKIDIKSTQNNQQNNKRKTYYNFISLSKKEIAQPEIYSNVDHALIKIEKEELKNKLKIPTVKEAEPITDSSWHEEFNELGAKIGYIRYDTNERWVIYFDDFGREYFVNSISNESSWTLPVNLNEKENTIESDKKEEDDNNNNLSARSDESSIISLASGKASIMLNSPTKTTIVDHHHHTNNLVETNSPKSLVIIDSTKEKEDSNSPHLNKEDSPPSHLPNLDFSQYSDPIVSYLALKNSAGARGHTNFVSHIIRGTSTTLTSSPSHNQSSYSESKTSPSSPPPFKLGNETSYLETSTIASSIFDPKDFDQLDHHHNSDDFINSENNNKAASNEYLTSPWARLKASTMHLLDAASELAFAENKNNLELNIPIKKKKVVQSRVRTWHVTENKLYKLKYSWLPQPMINKSVSYIDNCSEEDEGKRNKKHNSMSKSVLSTMTGGTNSQEYDANLNGTTNSLEINKSSYESSPKNIHKKHSNFETYFKSFVYSKTKEMRAKNQIHSSPFK